MENLNEKQKAALSALLKEYEKGLQVIAPTPLPNGDIMECDWRPGRVSLTGVLPKGVVFSGAVHALEGKAREELVRRIKRMKMDWAEFCNHRVRWQWEVNNAIKAVKGGNLSDPSTVLCAFRQNMEGDRDFLRGLLEGADENEPVRKAGGRGRPTKEAAKGHKGYPESVDALELLSEAARRWCGDSERVKYRTYGDVIEDMLYHGANREKYRHTIMVANKKTQKYPYTEWQKEWDDEAFWERGVNGNGDINVRVQLWAGYLAKYLIHA